MLPVATVRERGPAAGLHRLASHLRAARRAASTRPSRFILAWTGSLGALQVGALCAGLAVQGRPLPHPAAALIAAIALAVIAGLCLGVYLFVRMLGAGGRIAAVLVTAAFYGFCVTGSSEPDSPIAGNAGEIDGTEGNCRSFGHGCDRHDGGRAGARLP